MSRASRNACHTLAWASLLLVSTVGVARAQEIRFSNGAWTHVASACTVDEQSPGHSLGGAGLSFAASRTGEILARCNVTNLLQSAADTEGCSDCQWNTLEVVYRDPDGAASGNQVTVSLHEVSNTGLAEVPVTIVDPLTGRPVAVFDPSLVVQFNSNAAGGATAAVQTRSVDFSHDFNFEDNAYYVLLRVRRNLASTGNNPAVFVVRLLRRVFAG
jgi:hypothetical protein